MLAVAGALGAEQVLDPPIARELTTLQGAPGLPLRQPRLGTTLVLPQRLQRSLLVVLVLVQIVTLHRIGTLRTTSLVAKDLRVIVVAVLLVQRVRIHLVLAVGVVEHSSAALFNLNS